MIMLSRYPQHCQYFPGQKIVFGNKNTCYFMKVLPNHCPPALEDSPIPAKFDTDGGVPPIPANSVLNRKKG